MKNHRLRRPLPRLSPLALGLAVGLALGLLSGTASAKEPCEVETQDLKAGERPTMRPGNGIQFFLCLGKRDVNAMLAPALAFEEPAQRQGRFS